MISYNEIEVGSKIIYHHKPHEIIEASAMFKGRGQSALQVKLKNLITNSIISTTFHPADKFEVAEITKTKLKYLYAHKDSFVFCADQNHSQRFKVDAQTFNFTVINSIKDFLKINQTVEGVFLKEKLISLIIPIKISLKVTEALPSIKGERAEAGSKIVTTETGLKIKTPMFIKEGDIIEINTERTEYVRRIG